MRVCTWICILGVVLSGPRIARAEPTTDEVAQARHRRVRLAFTVGALGAGALAVGSLFGLSARSDWRKATDACNGTPAACPHAALSDARYLRELSERAATRANVLYAIGGATVAAAIALYLTAPEAPRDGLRITPTVDGGAVGLVVTGALR